MLIADFYKCHDLRLGHYIHLAQNKPVLILFFCPLQDALGYSNFFFDAQKVGTLPVDNPVTWRSDAMTYEVGPLDRDITGGYLQGGPAGNLKMTHPTAFSIALLAWGLLEFPTVSLLTPLYLNASLLCCPQRLSMVYSKPAAVVVEFAPLQCTIAVSKCCHLLGAVCFFAYSMPSIKPVPRSLSVRSFCTAVRTCTAVRHRGLKRGAAMVAGV